ncbi:MAG: RNA polymerase ECF-type sigma factor, partial [uncultured Rubrobacteraceae bacterium]
APEGGRGLPFRLAPRLRHPGPPARRPRPRRGGLAQRVCGGAGAVARERRASKSSGLARFGRPLQGHRRTASARPIRRGARGARRPARHRRRRSRGAGRTRRGGRPAAPDLHLLPPGPLSRCADRAHAARGLRPFDRRRRARLPGTCAHPRPAHRARQGEDPGGAHPLPGAPAGRAAREAGGRAARRIPGLQRGVFGLDRRFADEARPVGGGDQARKAARRVVAGAGGDRASRPDDAARVAPGGSNLAGGRRGPARGAGPLALGRTADTRRDRAREAGALVGPVRSLHGAGRDLGGARPGAERRRDGLDPDRRPLRPAGAGRTVTRDRAEPRRGGGDAGRSGGRVGAGRRHPGPRRPGRLPPRPRREGRPVPQVGKDGGSPGLLRAGALPRAARAGAALPGAAAGRTLGL